jgi:anti-anti-sigma factor
LRPLRPVGARVHLLAAMVILALACVAVSALLFQRAVHAELPGSGDAELADRLDGRLLEVGGLAGAFAIAVAVLVTRWMAAPLHRLTDVARRMTQGELETRAAGSGGGRELTELGDTLDRLAAALKRQDEVRRATAADVAHELRGALVGVVGRIEAMKDGLVQDQRATLAAMELDARRLGRLVDDIQLLADAQRPSLLVSKRPVELGEIVEEVLLARLDQFRSRSITVARRTAPAWVEGDPERIAQVLDNLLSNALRYTDPGGRVFVDLTATETEVILEVADSGVGIAPEHVDRIFDRFWRAPGASERAAEGSGVGLALVRDLVRAHHGRIEVDSVRGTGSRFRVILPRTAVARDDAPIVREPTPWGPGRPVGPTVWRLRGAIDLANAWQIQVAVVEALPEDGVDVVLDLDDVEFIDVSGVGALVSVEAHVRTRGGRTAIVANGQMQRLCRLLGVDATLDLVPTRSEAFASLAAPQSSEPVEPRLVRSVDRPPSQRS